MRLATERLVLRPPQESDLDALAAIFADAEVMRYVRTGRPLAGDEVATMIERMRERLAADGFGQLVAEREGRVVGRVGLLPHDPETWRPASRAELGERAEIELGWLLAREAWGEGYATEAAAAVLAWARANLGVPRLVSLIQHGNERSIRVAERLGSAFDRDIVTSFGKAAHLYAVAL